MVFGFGSKKSDSDRAIEAELEADLLADKLAKTKKTTASLQRRSDLKSQYEAEQKKLSNLKFQQSGFGRASERLKVLANKLEGPQRKGKKESIDDRYNRAFSGFGPTMPTGAKKRRDPFRGFNGF